MQDSAAARVAAVPGEHEGRVMFMFCGGSTIRRPMDAF